ncbi:hypothetical protein [Paenibacillus tyrfis]|uniref:Uncharacterized protein n=1 Tax=Paenibacillus tyrfis TaxID=1501230 RepID=A0A081PA72_9BACL|nr:hypothetical protein [Paenibacillus tyrfis]KEQ27595.1 hypothetical protein ET33_12930 [Paenibacillus tyrfis]
MWQLTRNQAGSSAARAARPEARHTHSQPAVPVSVAALLQMQKQVGNRAVTRLVRQFKSAAGAAVQRKFADPVLNMSADNASEWKTYLDVKFATGNHQFTAQNDLVVMNNSLTMHYLKLEELGHKDATLQLLQKLVDSSKDAEGDRAKVGHQHELVKSGGERLRFQHHLMTEVDELLALMSNGTKVSTMLSGSSTPLEDRMRLFDIVNDKEKMTLKIKALDYAAARTDVTDARLLANHYSFYIANNPEGKLADSIVEQNYASRAGALQDTQSKQTVPGLDPEDKGETEKKLKAAASTLTFESEAAALSHAEKHPFTNPDIGTYLKWARLTIEKGYADKIERNQLNNGYSVHFTFDSHVTIVRVDQAGEAFISTYIPKEDTHLPPMDEAAESIAEHMKHRLNNVPAVAPVGRNGRTPSSPAKTIEALYAKEAVVNDNVLAATPWELKAAKTMTKNKAEFEIVNKNTAITNKYLVTCEIASANHTQVTPNTSISITFDAAQIFNKEDFVSRFCIELEAGCRQLKLLAPSDFSPALFEHMADMADRVRGLQNQKEGAYKNWNETEKKRDQAQQKEKFLIDLDQAVSTNAANWKVLLGEAKQLFGSELQLSNDKPVNLPALVSKYQKEAGTYGKKLSNLSKQHTEKGTEFDDAVYDLRTVLQKLTVDPTNVEKYVAEMKTYVDTKVTGLLPQEASKLLRLRDELESASLLYKYTTDPKGFPKIQQKHSSVTDTDITADLIQHLISVKAPDPKSFVNSGVSGGHLESALMEFEQRNPTYHFELYKEKQINSDLKLKAYEQYRWIDTSKNAPDPSDLTDLANTLKWEKCQVKKTVADNLVGYLQQGEDAFHRWKKAGHFDPNGASSQRIGREMYENAPNGTIAAVSEDKLEFGGFIQNDPRKSRWVLTTLVPHIDTILN